MHTLFHARVNVAHVNVNVQLIIQTSIPICGCAEREFVKPNVTLGARYRPVVLQNRGL